MLPFAGSPGVGDAALGADGAFWITDPYGGTIQRLPLAGAGATYTVGGHPTRIAAGSDGALWFLYTAGSVRRITTAGQASTALGVVSGGLTAGDAIALGSDHAIWFTEANANLLGRVSPGGLVSQYAVPAAGNTPTGVTSAPDGTLWFLEEYRGGIVIVHATP